MTDYQRAFACAEAKHYADPDAFASDLLLSSEFLPEDETSDPDLTLLPALQAIWHTANDPFRVFLSHMGLTQSGCAKRFCIPLRTVQGWTLEEREAPLYVRYLIALAAGYIPSDR